MALTKRSPELVGLRKIDGRIMWSRSSTAMWPVVFGNLAWTVDGPAPLSPLTIDVLDVSTGTPIYSSWSYPGGNGYRQPVVVGNRVYVNIGGELLCLQTSS